MLEDAAVDVVDDLLRPRVALYAHARRSEMLFEPAEIVVDQAANGVVGRFSRPQVRWLAARDARHAAERRDAERLVLLDDELRPNRQVGES